MKQEYERPQLFFKAYSQEDIMSSSGNGTWDDANGEYILGDMEW